MCHGWGRRGAPQRAPHTANRTLCTSRLDGPDCRGTAFAVGGSPRRVASRRRPGSCDAVRDLRVRAAVMRGVAVQRLRRLLTVTEAHALTSPTHIQARPRKII